MDSKTGCPANYEELFQNYFPMMRSVVARSGIAVEDIEDVAMDILARFIEKDGIAYYDPERLHDVGENPDLPGARLRRARFGGMLRGFTATYVMQYRDKQMTRHRREPWRLETPVASKVGVPDVVTWGERNCIDASWYLDVEVSVSIVQAIRAARAKLDSTPKRDYEKFIDLCIEHGYFEGRLNRQRIAAEMGVSPFIVTTMLNEFRTTLREELAS